MNAWHRARTLNPLAHSYVACSTRSSSEIYKAVCDRDDAMWGLRRNFYFELRSDEVVRMDEMEKLAPHRSQFVSPLVVLLFRQIQITITTHIMASIELGHLAISFEQLSPLRGCLPPTHSTVRIACSRHRNIHPSSFQSAQPSPAQ